jgi:maltose alpha-D-glucosyltransferase/alpha-amylase
MPQLEAVEIPDDPLVLRLSAEQSNSSIIIGNKVIIKLIRRVMMGINPEVEVARYLTKCGYANTPLMLGEIMRVNDDGSSHSMIVAQAFVHNQGDAWQYTLNYLNRFIQALGSGNRGREDEVEQTAVYAVLARAIGTRLAQLHAVFATPSEDEAFDPLEVTTDDIGVWVDNAAGQLTAAFEVLSAVGEFSDQRSSDAAMFILGAKKRIIARLRTLATAGVGSLRTRIHGDFHLGQILVVNNDAFFIDFEGEPSKPLANRRGKFSPMRDVAGLLRSIHYAAAAAELAYTSGPTINAAIDHEGALNRFSADVSEQFLTAYRAVAKESLLSSSRDINAETILLDLFLLEKSAYEICYEAANRPSWLSLPLLGLYEIAKRVLQSIPETEHA